jgi:formyl-CoA transferase
VGIPIADLTAGNLLALGVMIALFERVTTGVGRWVTTSLLEAMIFMLDFQAARYLKDKEVAKQAGNDHPTSIPTGVFPTSDGFINIAASSSRVWERMCEAIGRPDWKEKPDWKAVQDRSRDRKAIHDAISAETKHKPSNHWIEVFEAAGVPCGPIYDIGQVFADPQVQHLGIARPMKSPELGTFDIVGSAINLTGLPKDIRIATAPAGAHTDEVLRSIGYTDKEIAAMRTKGIV